MEHALWCGMQVIVCESFTVDFCSVRCSDQSSRLCFALHLLRDFTWESRDSGGLEMISLEVGNMNQLNDLGCLPIAY